MTRNFRTVVLKYALWAGAAVMAALIGFAAGRWTAPEQPARIVEKFVERKDEKTAWQKTDDVKAAATTDTTAQQQVRIVTRWLRPDGTASREQVTESGQQTTSRSASAVVASGSASATAERTVEVVREVRVDLRPRWNLQGLAGLDLGVRRMYYGGAISRNLIGPIDIGVFGTTRKDVGLMLSVRF